MSDTKFEEYFKLLEREFESKKMMFETNSDRGHNSTIMRFMLEKATYIRMFCGEMSVFTNCFYEHINSSDLNTDFLIGDQLKNKLIDSLRDFIGRKDTKLKIFTVKKCEIDSSFIDPALLKEGCEKNIIEIHYIDPDKINVTGLNHVSFTENRIIRLETDPENHEALCGINVTEDIISNYENAFKIMEEALTTNKMIG